MAETTAVPAGPDPAADAGPWDAVPPLPPRGPAEEHPPGPAALYDPPPAPPVAAAVAAPAPPPVPPSAPAAAPLPMPPTGWTLTGMPAAGAPAPAASSSSATPLPFPVPGAGGAAPGTGGLGTAPRGRILVVEGGYGNSGRRTWGRGGPAQAAVLSAMLAAVSPQVLLAADAVDAVHLPGASDPQTVLAHLRAAARHPGPLLVHLGGHVVADKRGGQLQLTLRDAKQDGLPWQAIAAELGHRPADWQTLVIADLSADQNAWPYLQGTVSPLSEGIPLWAVVSPDPEQIGTFTRALIEALHGGRPGAGDVLAPEQLRQQVYSVLRPDVIILATHAPDRPVFRNTARRADGPVGDAVPAALPAPTAPFVPRPTEPQSAVAERSLATPAPAAAPAPAAPEPTPAPVAAATTAGGLVNLVKPGVPPTPPPPARPVSLLKGGPEGPAEDVPADVAPAGEVASDVVPSDIVPAEVIPSDAVPSGEAPSGVTLRKPAPADAVPEDAEPSAGVTLAKGGSKASEEPQDAVPADEVPTDAVPADEVPEVPEVPADAVPADTTPEAEAEPEAEPEPEAPAPVEAPAPAPASAEASAEASASGQPRADYREVIGRIVRSADAGDHAAATDLAFALELEAIAEHGAVSEPVLQVRQVRAHVCRLAGRTAEAADIYREVALTLLRSQGADHPETQQAATNAEACWRSIPDRAEALRIAPEIIELRAYLPGRDNRKLRAAERYLAQLAATAAPAEGS
ncbi:hypothetical protein [Kitasatospora sp. NPDC097643]|uniref:hypothetical protein n=1 Tax=Kitasatospora sp. NPDC097643 TaxID=3157230 RepID=UPI003326E80D